MTPSQTATPPNSSKQTTDAHRDSSHADRTPQLVMQLCTPHIAGRTTVARCETLDLAATFSTAVGGWASDPTRARESAAATDACIEPHEHNATRQPDTSAALTRAMGEGRADDTGREPPTRQSKLITRGMAYSHAVWLAIVALVCAVWAPFAAAGAASSGVDPPPRPAPVESAPAPPTLAVRQCTHWAVITSVNVPMDAVLRLSNMSEWCTVRLPLPPAECRCTVSRGVCRCAGRRRRLEDAARGCRCVRSSGAVDDVPRHCSAGGTAL
jgi:hypothetical protein